MQPNLLPGDLIFVASWPLLYTDFPERGDVITYSTEMNHPVFLKRVIGLPGDQISSKNGILYVNQKKLNDATLSGCFEETLDKKTYSICRETTPMQDLEPQEVFQDFLFVVDDFRVEALKTSHHNTWEMIPKSYVTGKVFLRWLSLKNRDKKTRSFLAAFRFNKIFQRMY
jgi:signal peptidase I